MDSGKWPCEDDLVQITNLLSCPSDPNLRAVGRLASPPDIECLAALASAVLSTRDDVRLACQHSAAAASLTQRSDTMRVAAAVGVRARNSQCTENWAHLSNFQPE